MVDNTMEDILPVEHNHHTEEGKEHEDEHEDGREDEHEDDIEEGLLEAEQSPVAVQSLQGEEEVADGRIPRAFGEEGTFVAVSWVLRTWQDAAVGGIHAVFEENWA